MRQKSKGFYVAKIYKEKASGTIENRPALEDLINDLQDAGVIIAESTDRLTRLPRCSASTVKRVCNLHKQSQKIGKNN